MTQICVSEFTIIGSDNGLSPIRCQAIIWINAGILLIRTLGTHFSEILIQIHTFSNKKMHLKMSSGKFRSFRLGLNVLSSWAEPWLSQRNLDQYHGCWWPRFVSRHQTRYWFRKIDMSLFSMTKGFIFMCHFDADKSCEIWTHWSSFETVKGVKIWRNIGQIR